jgi:MATE family multidrug resistance protein
MVTSTVTTFAHILWCYILVYVMDLDIIGASLATSFTYFLQFTMITVLCMKTKSLKKSFFFPTKETFKELGAYIKLAIPSTLMLIFDWWSFELLAILAGYISVAVTGAHIIILNVYYFFVMFCLGTHIAACVQVGRSIGQ